MVELREKLERVLTERALATKEQARLERMSLAELLYYALVEMDDLGWMKQDAALGV